MFKTTMLIQGSTNSLGRSEGGPRVGGWSESWYLDGSIDNVRPTFEALCQIRATLLTSPFAVIGQRYQLIGGGSSTAAKHFPGSMGTANDVPQMGLLCRLPAVGVANIRPFTFRGVGDDQVEQGEKSLTFLFQRSLNTFFRELARFQFRMRGRDLAAPSVRVASVINRVATFSDPLAFVVGDYIQLRDCYTSTGRLVSGRYQVEATTGNTNATLRGFPSTSSVDLSGFASKYSIIYPLIAPPPAPSVVRIVVKKVGRPFDLYRGRSSRTRR